MSDQELQIRERQEREAPTSSPPVVVGQGLAQRKARLALSRGEAPAQIAKAMRQFGLVDDDAVWEALNALVGNHVCAQVAMVLRPPQDVHSVGTTTAPEPEPESEPAPQPKVETAPQHEPAPQPEVTPAPQHEPAPQVESKPTHATGEISNDEAKARLTQGASAIGQIGDRAEAAPRKKRNLLKDFFASLGSLLTSTSESEDRVEPVAALRGLQGRLGAWVAMVDQAHGAPVGATVLPVAADDVDATAGGIAGEVAPPLVAQTRHVGIGLRSGGHAMALAALDEGTVDFTTLKLGQSIGSGTGGTVFDATYLGMAPVAYKLAKEHSTDVDKEAPLMGELDSPNVLKGGGLLPYVAKDGSSTRAGYAMEKAEHGSLQKVFGKLGTLTPDERVLVVQYLIRGGFRGLSELHQQGYVHGDVKDENFLLGSDLEAKLMDFGAARKQDDVANAITTGTDTHMAPEVKGSHQTQASDVWSMGETVLRGILDGWDSVDVAFGKKTPDFGKGSLRQDRAKFDEGWQEQLEPRVAKLRQHQPLLDFIGLTMAMDPAVRATAKQCLAHQFLQLTDQDEAKARDLLERVVTGKG